MSEASAAPRRDETFGPSALATPANAVTLARLLVTPVMAVLIDRWGPHWSLVVAWAVLSFSDGIDGWMARRHGTTRSGAFLDPLADKVVVLGALVALVARHLVGWLPVTIIAVREVAMSVYRTVVGRNGVSIPARRSAKLKTLLQDAAIGLCLMPPVARHHDVLTVAIWAAAAMTVFTGAQYVVDGRAAAATRRAGGREELPSPGEPVGPESAGPA